VTEPKDGSKTSIQKLGEALKRSPVYSMGVYANIVQKEAPKGFCLIYKRLCLNVPETRQRALGICGYTLEKKYHFGNIRRRDDPRRWKQSHFLKNRYAARPNKIKEKIFRKLAVERPSSRCAPI
jgi:hypothetical protein